MIYLHLCWRLNGFKYIYPTFTYQKPGESYPLTPTCKDGFKLEALDADMFSRNADNKIIELSISIKRARNVVFKKI
ncbi:MAG TPA: hypothetical protein VK588_13515 [Chitinophagaceae bacterium]|nr:hypothetical protein [Chitinophagaceae bacterium]